MFLRWLGPLLIVSDINNFENVEDIEDSIIWNKIEVMIDYGHEDLDICHRMCGRPNEKDTPFRQKIRSE